MVKCLQNVNIEGFIYTEPSTEKNDEFWVQWGIFMEYLKPKFYYGGVKKSNFLFTWHLQNDKKSIGNVMKCIKYTSFYSKKHNKANPS